MRQGTTPTHTFELPFSTELLSCVRILYSQGDELKLTKKDVDIQKTGNSLVVRLSQEDTFKFNCKQTVKIQVRALSPSGDALVSDMMYRSVDECLEHEVLA